MSHQQTFMLLWTAAVCLLGGIAIGGLVAFIWTEKQFDKIASQVRKMRP